MKTALLVVSFGTTHLDTLEKTIEATERTLAAAFPAYPVYRAFTSGIVRKRLMAQSGIAVDSVEEALARISRDGFEAVLVQPTLLIPGEEYDKLCTAVRTAAGAMHVSVCNPLLSCEKDLDALLALLMQCYPAAEDTVLVLMGHGSEHPANALYLQLAEKMRADSTRALRLCTVEGTPSFEDVVNELTAMTQRSVQLAPLLLVAGDHAKNDMAGTGSESLRSRLEEKGFCVTCCLQGLGELRAVQEMYVERVRAAALNLSLSDKSF